MDICLIDRKGKDGDKGQSRAWPFGAAVSPHRLLIIVLTLTCGALMTACGEQTPEKIEWHLPLTAPTDPHGSDVVQLLPAWAQQHNGSVVLALLEKRTARITETEIALGDSASMPGEMEISLLGLADGLRLKSGSYIDDENVHNPAAFVEVKIKDAVIYRGWLYQEFPELFGPDMADWMLRLKTVKIEKPEEDGKKTKRP